ncbi:MAG: L-threonylcarbamoyladenylate synthase [Chlorobiota bacterium]
MTIISNNIDKAAEILQQGDLVAIPTETVYGLAGSIYSESAIRKIFEVKQRPLFNPLIVHLYSVEQVSEIASHIPEKAMLLAEAFWPGSLTLVLPKKDIIPDLITAGKDTVAMRIPNHPVTQELLKKLPFPLAAPSANPFNRISPTSAKHVESYFKDSIKMVLDGGECKKGLESTIIGFEGDEPVLYRLGSISKEEIEEVVGEVQVKNKKESAPNAPGMLEKHYAPRTKTILVDSVDEINISTKGKRVGLLSLTQVDNSVSYIHVEILSESGDMDEAAANLYKALHKLDSHDLDIIIAIRLPDKGLGRSINDRLERAAK